MIDLSNIEKYRENNRIEAKKALGGLPQSIWETYSSFANTLGGILLLGVEEQKDKSLHPIRLPDPERLVAEFWRIVNDPARVSVNILTDRNVQVQRQGESCIIAITVPRANRRDLPVYLDGNLRNSYRRNGEGDYRCSPEEIAAMLRDAEVSSQDRRVLEGLGTDALDGDSIGRYREQLGKTKPGHLWNELKDEDFLLQAGALGMGADAALHPTAAGLLMFGKEAEIVREYPHYSLRFDTETEEERLCSSSEDWSGNLYDFYLRVCGAFSGYALPDGSVASSDSAVYSALCEALANCLVNGDYHGKRGTVILLQENCVTMSNPGTFRVRLSEARVGGVSDPRHETLMSLFHLIGVGARTGSGLPGIFAVWRKRGWADPVITESFAPEGITLTLPFGKEETKIPQTSARPLNRGINALHRRAAIEYLTANVTASRAGLAEALGISHAAAGRILTGLEQEGIAVSDGAARNRVYRLKA